MASPGIKPYVRLAYSLVIVGMGVFAFERLGLSQMGRLQLPGWLVTVLVVAPVGLILAGCLVFMIGRARRL